MTLTIGARVGRRLPVRPATVACLCLLHACAAEEPRRIYEGPERPAEEVATVHGAKIGDHTFLPGLNKVVLISEVDGKGQFDVVRSLKLEPDFPRSVQVLPGKHRFVFKYLHEDQYAYASLWLVAEAGGSYSIRLQSDRRHVQMILVDDANGAEVGGLVGSSDEPR